MHFSKEKVVAVAMTRTWLHYLHDHTCSVKLSFLAFPGIAQPLACCRYPAAGASLHCSQQQSATFLVVNVIRCFALAWCGGAHSFLHYRMVSWKPADKWRMVLKTGTWSLSEPSLPSFFWSYWWCPALHTVREWMLVTYRLHINLRKSKWWYFSALGCILFIG